MNIDHEMLTIESKIKEEWCEILQARVSGRIDYDAGKAALNEILNTLECIRQFANNMENTLLDWNKDVNVIMKKKRSKK